MAGYRYIRATGAIVPDTSTTRAEVEAEFRDVFGDDLDTDPSTPQGQLITRIVLMRDAVVRNNVAMANQLDPSVASGVFLDAIFAFMGGRRREATRSVIYDVELGGVPHTVVPAGSVAMDTSGAEFELASEVTLDAGGWGLGVFIASEDGPITVPPHGLKTVASSVLGWTTVDNPFAAITGSHTESDLAVRRRRALTLGKQSIAINEAVVGAVVSLDGVHSVYYLENDQPYPQNIEGVYIQPHSLWIAVQGGDRDEIAKTIFDKKGRGTGTEGGELVNVPDPYKTDGYDVRFERPDNIRVQVRVTVRPTVANVADVVREAVLAYSRQEIDGDVSFTVGADISPWEIAGAINQLEPLVNVRRVELRVDSGPWSQDVITIEPWEIGTLDAADIEVRVEGEGAPT